MKHWCLVVLALFASVLASCNKDDADEDYSTLTADMCDLQTNSKKVISMCVMDDGRQVQFVSPVTISWATTPDSTYRALLYYNKVAGSERIEPFSVLRALCMTPKAATDSVVSRYKDPVQLISSWYAKNGKYLNLCLAVKTGDSDGERAHTLAVINDSTSHSGHRHYLRVCHSQNGLPAYYSMETYSSIVVEDIPKGDTVTLSVPTFSGIVVKDMVK